MTSHRRTRIPAPRETRRFLAGLLSAAWVALVAVVSGAEHPAMPVGGLCAHRGGGATQPENTLPALAEAVRLGVPMVEFDLALTQDGALVLMHDAKVDRTTDGHGRVLDFTLAELQRLDAGGKKAPRFRAVRVPTFEEALAVLPRDIWINVDFKADARFAGKSAEVVRQVARIVVAQQRIHQVLLAARAADARAAREVAPGLLICSMDRQSDPAAYVTQAIAQRADFIQLRDCAHDPRLAQWIAALKAAGVRINYFYANDPAEVARLRAAGVDFVLVDAPETVLAGLAALPSRQP